MRCVIFFISNAGLALTVEAASYSPAGDAELKDTVLHSGSA